MSRHLLIPLSPCPPVPLSPCLLVSLSPCLLVPLSPCLSVSLSLRPSVLFSNRHPPQGDNHRHKGQAKEHRALPDEQRREDIAPSQRDIARSQRQLGVHCVGLWQMGQKIEQAARLHSKFVEEVDEAQPPVEEKDHGSDARGQNVVEDPQRERFDQTNERQR